MKHFYLTFLFLIFSAISYAQCPPAGLTITNQSQIDTFIINYPNCTEINGDLIIDEANITSLAGFANISSITGALEIREVPNLQNLNGLQNLETVGTDLILREVDALQHINALSSLTSVGGEFTVRSCPDLVHLDGIENLTTVGLGLIIRNCASLVSLQGLAGVTFVGEILEVVENPVLASLSGLENIATVVGGDEGALVIEGNDLLSSLAGLGSEATVMTGDITLSANGLLALCAVPSICAYLQTPPENALITINANLSGCNSQQEVQTACAVLDTDYFEKALSLFRVLKNPISSELNVHSTLGNGTVSVYEATGKMIQQYPMKRGVNTYPFNATSGIYFVKMEAEGKVENVKIIKHNYCY